MEVLRLFQQLGIKPRHSIRAVFFMNEENGSVGGKTYARLAKENGETHLAAIESDAGGFTPRGFSIDAEASAVSAIQQFKSVLAPYGFAEIEKGGGGADINHLKDQKNSPDRIPTGFPALF